jgi:hypothetical protein
MTLRTLKKSCNKNCVCCCLSAVHGSSVVLLQGLRQSSPCAERRGVPGPYQLQACSTIQRWHQKGKLQYRFGTERLQLAVSDVLHETSSSLISFYHACRILARSLDPLIFEYWFLPMLLDHGLWGLLQHEWHDVTWTHVQSTAWWTQFIHLGGFWCIAVEATHQGPNGSFP